MSRPLGKKKSKIFKFEFLKEKEDEGDRQRYIRYGIGRNYDPSAAAGIVIDPRSGDRIRSNRMYTVHSCSAHDSADFLIKEHI